MYESQSGFWDDFGWLADEEAAKPVLNAAFGQAWATDDGALLFAAYQRMDSTNKGLVEAAVDEEGSEGSTVQVATLFANASGKAAAAPVQKDGSETYDDAEDLAGAQDVAWRAYAGWWRRHDGTAWVFARSNRRDDTWVDQDTMVAAAAKPVQQAVTPAPQQQTTYADATALADDNDPAWRAYAGWWRRAEGSTWLFARSNRRDDTWVDQARMVELAAKPVVQQRAPEPVAEVAPVVVPEVVDTLDLSGVEIPEPPSGEDVPDALFDTSQEMSDAEIDQVINEFPQVQEVVLRLLDQAAETVVAGDALDALAELDEDEIAAVLEAADLNIAS
jgi:hypothetical protein